jgi:hypothetical protein
LINKGGNKMTSISQFDNTKEALPDFLEQMATGKIQMPDLQRSFCWSDEKIRQLLSSVSQAWPIGAILTLKTDKSSLKFKPKLIEGVELEPQPEPEILLLDGQQRCTGLYMSLRSGKPVVIHEKNSQKIKERFYYINIAAALNCEIDKTDTIISLPASRIKKCRGINIDCSTPEKEFELLLFPVAQIFSYSSWRSDFQKYWNYDPEKLNLIDSFESEVIKKFEHYQLPVIQLRQDLSKLAVCKVFERANESSIQLTFFDLTTSQFAAEDFSLREHFHKVKQHLSKFTIFGGIRDTDWLQVVTLIATYHRREEAIKSNPNSKLFPLPSVGCRKHEVFSLTLEEYQKFSPQALIGFEEAGKFLYGLKFQSEDDIAYLVQIVVLGAILSVIGSPNEHIRSKLECWWWSGIFSEMYSNSYSTMPPRDMLEVPKWLFGGDLPTTVKSASFSSQRLMSLIKRHGVIFKGLNALLRKNNAIDFVSGESLSDITVFDGIVESHHIFPEAWCKQHGIKANQFNCLVNRTLLKNTTNRFIGGKAPSEYLSRIVKQQGISKKRINEILRSHLIEPDTLWDDDFNEFFHLRARALLDLIEAAMNKPTKLDLSEELNLNSHSTILGNSRGKSKIQ